MERSPHFPYYSFSVEYHQHRYSECRKFTDANFSRLGVEMGKSEALVDTSSASFNAILPIMTLQDPKLILVSKTRQQALDN